MRPQPSRRMRPQKKSLQAFLRKALATLAQIVRDVEVHLHVDAIEDEAESSGKEGRKMGHVTIVETNIENALSKAVMIRHLLKGGYEQK